MSDAYDYNSSSVNYLIDYCRPYLLVGLTKTILKYNYNFLFILHLSSIFSLALSNCVFVVSDPFQCLHFCASNERTIFLCHAKL